MSSQCPRFCFRSIIKPMRNQEINHEQRTEVHGRPTATAILNTLPAVSFHLIPESAGGQPLSPSKPARVEVPPGCSFIAPTTSLASFLSLGPSPSVDAIGALEPVSNGERQPRLLLLNKGVAPLRVNGNPASRVTLLRERDQLQFDDSCCFHVALFHRPQIGAAPADIIGKPCPICLTPFTGETSSICYHCPCGAVLHLQDPAGLECARAVHDCPRCHQPISLLEGYSWFPTLDS